MSRYVKTLDPDQIERVKKRAARLDESAMTEKLTDEMLEKISGAGSDDDDDLEIHVGWCPRCQGKLYVAIEDGGMLYFCKDCHYYYFEYDPFGDDYY